MARRESKKFSSIIGNLRSFVNIKDEKEAAAFPCISAEYMENENKQTAARQKPF